MKKKTINIIVIILLIVLDQFIKSNINLFNDKKILRDFIKITYTKNTGGAFSIGVGHIDIIIIASILIIISVVIIKKFVYKKECIGFTLVLAGGIGNLVDRLFKGFVIDYIDITGIINFPIFNFADILVCIGTVILLIYILKRN